GHHRAYTLCCFGVQNLLPLVPAPAKTPTLALIPIADSRFKTIATLGRARRKAPVAGLARLKKPSNSRELIRTRTRARAREGEPNCRAHYPLTYFSEYREALRCIAIYCASVVDHF